MRTRIVTLVLAAACIAGLGDLLGTSEAAARRSGTIVEVDPAARTLMVDELGQAGKPRRLVLRIAADARIVLSERRPEAEREDAFQPFRTTPIGLDELRSGDFVVIESTPGEGREVATSIAVTLREGTR